MQAEAVRLSSGPVELTPTQPCSLSPRHALASGSEAGELPEQGPQAQGREGPGGEKHNIQGSVLVIASGTSKKLKRWSANSATASAAGTFF